MDATEFLSLPLPPPTAAEGCRSGVPLLSLPGAGIYDTGPGNVFSLSLSGSPSDIVGTEFPLTCRPPMAKNGRDFPEPLRWVRKAIVTSLPREATVVRAHREPTSTSVRI